ncbi:hypothetical protein [Paraburkholderia sp. RL17-347-BIC-D]|uniref:hypothetical protein n=1 Tax=Paraburkholderia sp. RL17-347-BIC-D TaxID=3031632 RepID=UPI0038B99C3F
MNHINEVLDQVTTLVDANRKKLGVLGARAMVLGAFLEAAMPHFTTSQRAEISRSFRRGIEEAMSLMDDLVLPAEYHSALLELTNAILATLGQQSVARG